MTFTITTTSCSPVWYFLMIIPFSCEDITSSTCLVVVEMDPSHSYVIYIFYYKDSQINKKYREREDEDMNRTISIWYFTWEMSRREHYKDEKEHQKQNYERKLDTKKITKRWTISSLRPLVDSSSLSHHIESMYSTLSSESKRKTNQYIRRSRTRKILKELNTNEKMGWLNQSTLRYNIA